MLSPTAGPGWLPPWGRSLLQMASPSPRVSGIGAEGGTQGTATCLRLRIQAGLPPSGAPDLPGRPPPLTHILVTTVPPKRSDTSASVLGGIFHVKWPSRKGTGKVLDEERPVRRAWGRVGGGTRLQTEGTAAGPVQSRSSRPHTWPGLSTQQSTQAWAPLRSGLQARLLPLALPLGPGTSHFPEHHVLTPHTGLLVTAPRGPKKEAHRDCHRHLAQCQSQGLWG